MLTPGYSLTAPERVLPSMALDFTTASLDSRVAVTRALNTATRVNNSGLIESVNANLPRFDFASSGVCNGLLIEEARTNILLQSTFAASWPNANAVLNANQFTSPDGTTNAAEFKDNTSSAVHVIFQNPATTAGTNYAASVFVEKTAGRYITLSCIDTSFTGARAATFDLNTGLVTQSGAYGSNSTFVSAGMSQLVNGYYRLYVVGSNTAASTYFQICGTNAGTFSADIFGRNSYIGANTSWKIYGAQLEQGAFATSYIPTTTTSLTRNADVVQMTGTNFSSWYNASEGTMVSTAYRQSLGDIPTFVCIDDGTASNKIEFISYSNYDAEAQVFTLGSQQANPYTAGNVYPVNTQRTIAFGYKVNSFYGAFNGAAMPNANPDTTGTIPTVTQLQFGRRAALVEGAVTISTFRYYPFRLTNAEIVAISKG